MRRYLREGEAAAVRRPAPKRAEKLDSFKTYIIDRVKAAAPDRIPAVVLYREIKSRGYDGGETRVVPGDILAWPAGVRDGHRLHNRSAEPCVFVAISGGDSWITGSPRSSARQIRPAS